MVKALSHHWSTGNGSVLEATSSRTFSLRDEEKARLLLARLLKVDPKRLPPANPNDVDGELLEADDEVSEKEP
jgi:hypothetical protein